MKPNTETASAPTIGLFWPSWTLWRREIVRFLRQRSRVIGALGTPLVFWLLIGGGLGRSFKLPGVDASMSYLEYTYPGAIGAILLFTSIFSMISIIDDRREGFMQGVLVAPVSRLAIVLGKVSGATTLAVAQAVLFLALAPVAEISLSMISVIATVGAMVLVALAVTSLGFWMAWRMESVQGFHAVMNLVLMPMLVLSGAFFPPEGSATLIRWVVNLNPMTYAIALIRQAMYFGSGPGHLSGQVGLPVAFGVSVLFAAVMLGLSVKVATNKTSNVSQ
ncbi:MAG: ABC transporter permease [Phycisphaerales bacterium]|nr:ABC transporter permease [Phycisphaerales bacterium]